MHNSAPQDSWLKPSHVTASFTMLIVSWGSAAVIIFQAANSLGATSAQITSWFTILALLSGIASMALSWRYRVPIYIAWSTPGAALIALTSGVPLNEALGASIFAGFLAVLLGLSGLFAWMVKHIPANIAAAMLAGILINFGMGIFTSMQSDAAMVVLMLGAYLLSKQFWPKYSLLLMLFVGAAYAYLSGSMHFELLHWQWPSLEWVTPVFDWQTLLSLGIPLFLITLSTQNIPGVAVLHSHGYRPPVSPIMVSTGLITMLFAPFGAFMLNLAAISAAICMGDDVDADPKQRYKAMLVNGVMNFGVVLMGGMVVMLFGALPKTLLLTLAGIAILSTLIGNLVTAVADADTREAALFTLLAAASGIQLWGISSAFWGLLLGMAVYHLNRYTAARRSA
ncbi:benzoate/H(+) symporter BenE family transporter [Vitreoscilla massiliensis]|nr:benzoate/H(+) symporter BenE family transporter [Vitreoscilla massiliensis]